MKYAKLRRGKYLLLCGLAAVKNRELAFGVEERAERLFEGEMDETQRERGTHIRLNWNDYTALCELASQVDKEAVKEIKESVEEEK